MTLSWRQTTGGFILLPKQVVFGEAGLPCAYAYTMCEGIFPSIWITLSYTTHWMEYTKHQILPLCHQVHYFLYPTCHLVFKDIRPFTYLNFHVVELGIAIILVGIKSSLGVAAFLESLLCTGGTSYE